MTDSVIEEKNAVRKEMLRKRKELNPEFLRETDLALPSRIIPWIRRILPKETHPVPTVMSYMSYRNEFPTHLLNQALLEEGWRLILPYTSSDFSILACAVSSLDQLRISPMGIAEPDPAVSEQITASEADLILLPGVAFDRHGMRLGYGKGCYDRFLGASCENSPTTAAFAWSFQILDCVPSDPHDQPVDWLITEEEFLPL